LAASIGLACSAGFACSGTNVEGPDDAHRRRTGAPGGPGTKGVASTALALDAEKLASVPGGTFGPYIGQGSGGSIVAWAAAESGDKRAWYSLALSSDGKPQSKPLRVADAPRELGLVAVRAAGGARAAGLAAPGFVLISTRRGEEERVEALELGPRGELRAGPTLLTNAADEVLWVEAIATDSGTLALWALRRGDRAELFALALGRTGQKMGEPQLVLGNARAWQASSTPSGAAIAAVVSTKSDQPGGSVDVVFLDSAGKPQGRPVSVSTEPSAERDIDLVRVGENLLLGWSDRRGIEPRVYVAALDGKGTLLGKARPLGEPFGEQAFVRLVAPAAGGTRAFVAWENLLERPRTGRRIRLATISADGSVGTKHSELEMLAEDGSIPELSASAQGLAALTLASACEKNGACDAAERLPTFVRFGNELEVLASEPLRLAPLRGGIATLAWGMTCADARCFALAALATTPAPVFAVKLERRSDHWRPAGWPVRRAAAPRAASIEAVAGADPLSDAAAARVGDTTLAAWITYFDPTTPWERLKKPAPDGRFDPLQARLEIRAIGKSSADSPAAQNVSLRARSLGGVALTSGEPAHKDALIAWAAIDNKQPQVFLTLVDATGRRLQQKMLTRRQGDVGDVALASVSDGFFVAWVDERHTDPEVYVTKVNRMLQRVAPERRLTTAAGGATGVTLLARGDHVIVAWADARDAEHPGWADIHGAKLRASDGEPLAAEHRIAESRLHSHSPVLAALGTNTVIAWIDHEPEASSPAAGTGVRIALLDDKASTSGEPATISASGGTPRSLALECSARCRFVMSVDPAGRGELQAFEWQPGVDPKIVRLAGLSGPGAQSVAPTLLGRELFYADQAGATQGRVRRMLIDWD
jgi:hypothetical protein